MLVSIPAGINVLDGGVEARQSQDLSHYYWGSVQPDLPSWTAASRQRLYNWGFNTAGDWSLPPRLLKMPAVIDLAHGKRLRFLWTDPFDPQSVERMRRTVQQEVALFKGDPYRIG